MTTVCGTDGQGYRFGLLNKHGYRDVGSFDMTPVHAVTYGQK